MGLGWNKFMTTGISSAEWRIEETRKGQLVVHLKSNIDINNTASLYKSLIPTITKKRPSLLTLDLSQVTYLDDYGTLAVLDLESSITANGGQFQMIKAAAPIREAFERAIYTRDVECSIFTKDKVPNIFVRFGDATIRELYHLRFMTSFLGSVVLGFLQIFFHPKSLRMDDTITYMKKTGVDAVPIVGLISFLLGLIMAFMSSIQLRQFGANIYVASLVALAMVSELGPIMTAIVVSGRTGSAYAAEIGTMQISEEIDALFTMGFNPTLFLAVPRILAVVVVVPLLTFFSDFFAVTGGMVVGVFMLDLTPGAYITQTLETLTLFEVVWGMLKSVVFALLIGWTGCLRGFQVRGGAASVGNAATSAVVSSIFLIILFDSMFAVIRSYW
jgi:phospholipid/cholesterol/gamma-HCH transport system permease protein